MSSETKGMGQRWPQPTRLQNGLRHQGEAGQHLDRSQAGIHTYFWTGHVMSTCGPKQGNSTCNGYDHPPLANQRGHVRLDKSCQAELMRVQWNRPLGNGLQHNRVSVNYSLRECSFVACQRQTEPHLSSGKCVLDAPAQFRGHGNCGSPVCAAEQQSGSVREALLKEPNASDWTRTSDFDSVLYTSNGRSAGQDLNLAHKVMFSTKDYSSTHQQIRRQEDVAQGDVNGPGKTSSSKQSQRAIQDQIQNVVVNLEEVLHGLKEIHLEMNEVVRQIDLLTADIDMGEDDPGGALSSKMKMDIPESESPRCGDSVAACSSNKAQPAYSIRDQTQSLGSTQEMVHSQRHESRTATGRREQKPPPYPYPSTTGRVNTKAKGQKAPPYPFRRRLLSTIV
ncbi:uncharacterized protein LOC130548308 [Triplophysa rosa]|uniref:Protein Largen n=1 Tax=Triplophysa rosa TaxID=992332 RepID=A0A9W7T677_TRIRA|nr:uncharacterized protein LOC130548308 [Triplophysa rosa]XP_057180985.1 uncharacterized protein LOC130548308 [Triplophysa rosa]KAI7791021.1 hypothetical protein IRJ41_007288 [Triplophysa rosa]